MKEADSSRIKKPRVALLHYSAAPVVGGVEAVIDAHARLFVEAGYPVTIIAGKGEAAVQPAGVQFERVTLMDSRHPTIAQAARQLNEGQSPEDFESIMQQLVDHLGPLLRPFDVLIVHNVLGKHFNLPLTAALVRLLEAGKLPDCIAWGHDFSWTSPNSRDKMHPGYPWDLLRTRLVGVTYVAVSKQRQNELAGLFGCSREDIHVVYNGVDPGSLLGLSRQGVALAGQLGLMASDLTLLMPVRITQAKNIELAMEVAASLKRQGISARLVVTGPPDPHDEGEMGYFHNLLALRGELDVEQEVQFIFESGSSPTMGLIMDAGVIGELYRLSDMMFMPSHREGFGMPVLEAGLVGLPVLASRAVPAAVEVAREDALLFDSDATPAQIAAQVIAWMASSRTYHLRRRVRQNFTWEAIFQDWILPLLIREGRVGDQTGP